MTTIACNRREIAADTRVTWEEVGKDVISAVKLFPSKKGAIYGMTGSNCTGVLRAVEWLQSDRNPDMKPQPPEYEHGWDWRLIELSADGIAVYNELLEREQTIEPVLAVGSGRKVALYCMKYLGMSPAEAVREACRVDHWSAQPIYVASLANPVVTRWTPKPRRKAGGR